MKKVILFLFLSAYVVSFSQNLSDGSVLFTSVQSDGDKTFSFVVLEEIIGGQQIVFTDRPLDSLQNLIGNEGEVVWQAPDEGITIGEVVAIIDTGTGWANLGSVSSISGNFNLSTSGDQLIAFELYDIEALTDTVFIAALNFGSGNSWVSSGVPSTNQSYLPENLTSVLSFDAHRDNGSVDCLLEIETLEDLKASVLDYDNWITSHDILDNSYCQLFELQNVVAVNDSYNKKGLAVYPNPVNGRNLFFDKELTNIKVINSLGVNVRILKRGEEMVVEGLAQGIYILSSDQGTVKFKIE